MAAHEYHAQVQRPHALNGEKSTDSAVNLRFFISFIYFILFPMEEYLTTA